MCEIFETHFVRLDFVKFERDVCRNTIWGGVVVGDTVLGDDAYEFEKSDVAIFRGDHDAEYCSAHR